MAGCGRRFAVRASIACFAAAIGLGTTPAASEAAAKPIQITVQVGYHNTVKLGQWTPVVVGIIRSGLQPLVVHLAPAEISDSAPVLRAFDLIAIDDFATDSLTEGQRTALADYVVQGGALLLGTGGSWHKTLAGLPSAMVPMKVTGSKVLGSAGALSGVGRLEVATGTLTPGSSAWLAESDQPLLVEAPVGAGLVEMATFDWNQDSISSWNGISALLRKVF